MSNSRIFCIAWMAWNGLSTGAELMGFPGRYSGLASTISQAIVGIVAGVTAVALIGDRKAKP